MSELTLEQSIKDAHRVWTEIASTGLGKANAVQSLLDEEQSHLAYLDDGNSLCPFCAYDRQSRGGDCSNCPAFGMWEGYDNLGTCVGQGSVYNSTTMSQGSPYERKLVAINMLGLIKKVAKKYNVKL